MLNKLLKRCMPWMDKGRWYHVRVDTIGDTPTAVFDPVFESVSFPGDYIIRLKIHSGRQYQLIDAKASINKFRSTIPGFTEFMDLTNIMSTPQEPSALDVAEVTNAITDYWFFMTPLDEYIEE